MSNALLPLASASPRTRKRIALSVTVLAVIGIAVAGTLAAIGVNASETAGKTPPPAAGVDVAEVISRKIVDWQSYSGRLEALNRVEIRPLVSGTLTAVHFKDGSTVKKGDLLFTIDPRPYAAEVARAQAQLAGTEARAAYTGTDVARGERLLADNAIARRDYEEKQNAAREASASLQAARAALQLAKLNLEYTHIVAPVAGRISRAEVTVGNIVTAGAASQALSTLVSIAPIYASFNVDEQSYLKFIHPTRSGAAAPVALGLANEEGYSRQGKVGSVDNRVDPASGTIRVRAVFDNADGALLPGLYARIRLGSSTPRDAVLIDPKAIGTDQDKRFVLVLNKDNHTAYREVLLGASQDGLQIIESGLHSGERIVVNGLQRVRPGDAVTPTLLPMQPAANAAPAKPAA
ncbi:efflux RND transporter periplasmic adaptor subunit [Herbaspirillum sp. RTI4]|uniref:efflux RND transporter periplasmic adaptor subunit n=1 Tax=Herbaspirillum sp. RTI4 TaxID=3048640 RepID=UPI002AB3E8E1|nr:efflux RND transporter periplasmic adaptor subunit [Herbaspirillum sp. RTI4]MDY7577395.1 efflux RND transporter periplasmic adaptor subunit [Herbaspirillum sp. RTI4]MEA9983379.1 efflux RND transporter periplasmic adaptor subunit [Herbaspirillum sp. RTI4]